MVAEVVKVKPQNEERKEKGDMEKVENFLYRK